MPLYTCNAAKGAISDTAKAEIADDITRIHCDVTGAPSTFVHVFFFEDAPHLPLNGKKAWVHGGIRAGRTDAQKMQITEQITESVRAHTGLPVDSIMCTTLDTPASWVMEGGDILPEPGEEAAWLEAHAAKVSAPSPA